MVDVTKSLVPALMIPLLLIIMVAVYMSTTDSTSFAFEVVKVSEDSGEDATGSAVEAIPLYDCKIDSVTAVSNTTDALTAGTSYNVTYDILGPCTIDVGLEADSGNILVNYTSYSGDGYTAFDKMNTQTYSGFKLASTIPYVIIAMVVLALVIGTFTLV